MSRDTSEAKKTQANAILQYLFNAEGLPALGGSMKNCNNCFWLFSRNLCEYTGETVPEEELSEGCTYWRHDIEYCAGHTFTIGPQGKLTITPTDKSDERYLSRRKT